MLRLLGNTSPQMKLTELQPKQILYMISYNGALSIVQGASCPTK